MKLARGYLQQKWLRELCAGQKVRPGAGLVGRADQYRRHYVRSFLALKARMEATGFVFETRPGRRGGEYGRSWWLTNPPVAGIETFQEDDNAQTNSGA